MITQSLHQQAIVVLAVDHLWETALAVSDPSVELKLVHPKDDHRIHCAVAAWFDTFRAERSEVSAVELHCTEVLGAVVACHCLLVFCCFAEEGVSHSLDHAFDWATSLPFAAVARAVAAL